MARRPTHDTSRRDDHHGAQMGLQEIGYLGRDVWTRAQPEGLVAHRHRPGFWELCWLERGRMDWQVDGQRTVLRGGDCFLARPRQLHGGQGGIMHPGELWWISFSLRRLPGLVPAQARVLRRGFAAIQQRSFPASPAVAAAFAAILAEFRRGDAYAAAMVRAQLHALLIAALRAASEATPPSVSPQVLRALDLIEETLGRPTRIGALAAAVGLGPARFHERFRAEVGCTPAEHVARRRIARAQDLLRAGTPIAQVAAELGFASRSHFGAVFRRLAGQTPATWRQALPEGTTSSSRRSSR